MTISTLLSENPPLDFNISKGVTYLYCQMIFNAFFFIFQWWLLLKLRVSRSLHYEGVTAKKKNYKG
jgi:hypothetical protein